ncbi:MAG: trehalose-phosphatase [Acidobacteriota bacterium]
MSTRLLLACDFDGTIAGIQTSPDLVELYPRARSLFEEANRHPDIVVAFISGRDLEDLRGRTEEIRAWRCGSHGRDISSPDGLLVVSTEPLSVNPEKGWLVDAAAAGVRMERKRHGFAIHWREALSIDRDHPLIVAFAAWASTEGLLLVEGRKVLEATVPGPSKVDALRLLAEVTEAARVVYAGDDLTDFEALAWAAPRGKAIFVSSPERNEALPHRVQSVGSLDEVVDTLWLEIDAPASE